MQACPKCKSGFAWRLGDGRSKCRGCGTRFSSRSVWDSVRLAGPIKHALLQAFVDGIPAYRQRFDDGACIDSRERFYRLLRACCALQAAVSREALHVAACESVLFGGARTSMRGWALCRRVVLINIGECAGGVQLNASQVDGASMLPLLRERSAVGGIFCSDDAHGFANLQVQGDYVIVPRMARAALARNCIESFWEYARAHLQTFRKIPLKFMPLYLGEVCFRFNRRGQDLAPLLLELMQSTEAGAIKVLLDGGGAHSSLRAGARAKVVEPVDVDHAVLGGGA